MFMNTLQKNILVSICCSFLLGCHKPVKDPNPYTLAVNSNSGMQRTKYVPVAVPGQLMSLKDTGGYTRLVGEAAIAAANKKAVKQPNSGEYINSIMTFDYMPGALYQIYAAPLSVTDIQFQIGEHIIAVGAGDTVRWQVSRTHSGNSDSRQEHLLIKPVDEGLSNSLVVTTDLRTYHLMLHSKPKTYMASVTWRYPDSEGLVTKFDDDPDGGISDITSGVDVSRLNFNYTVKLIKGAKPDWYPRMVFNDGKKTYIKFPNHVQDSPMLFVGDKKNSQLVNFRPQGNYYIVDNIFYLAQLHSGQDGSTVVQIAMKTKQF